jgi:hypothetical protein
VTAAAADKPITDEEMAAIIRRALARGLSSPELTSGPPGDSFLLHAPATGQHFRVTVSEVQP